MTAKNLASTILAACLAIAPFRLHALSASVTIVNGDPAGVGFNDTTAVAPIGGNPGTTLGAQRLIAFQAAAVKWGSTLTSTVPIKVHAIWTALTCTATSAVLGSAGATEVFSNFSGAPVASHWYPKALADKLSGSDIDPATEDIDANFNINLGKAGCLTGTFFYLGVDNNHGANVDLVTVLTHELGHGLGFQTFTNGSTGVQLGSPPAVPRLPSIWDDFLLDSTTNKNWTSMTNAQRAASALKSANLVWTGSNVTTNVPNVLQLGTPQLIVSTPASVAGSYQVGTASFGPPLSTSGVTGEVMPVVDQPNGTGLACNAFSAANALAVSGKIALVDRGTCGFNIKVENAQNSGAIGVLVVDNVAGSPPAGLGGTDPTVTIPAVRITLADGNTLKAALATRTRIHSGMFATLGLNPAVYAGADTFNRMLMYAPNPFQAGSSVSHYDVSAFPNQLMEPAINGDLTHEVTPPQDLTFMLLKDIGWN